MSAAEWIEELDENASVLEPRSTYDQAIVGLIDMGGENRVCYSFALLVDALVEHEDASYEEATDHICVNIIGSVGLPGFPVVLHGYEEGM